MELIANGTNFGNTKDINSQIREEKYWKFNQIKTKKVKMYILEPTRDKITRNGPLFILMPRAKNKVKA